MANQAGWVLGCPLSFSASWDGSDDPDHLRLCFAGGEGRNIGQISSHFGCGILTFSVPWLFRTSPGIGLLVRGPSNSFKDGIAPLDGLVETDWAPYTFTMNWRFTRPGAEVRFKEGEPVCMIAPYPLDLLESVQTRIEAIERNPVLHEDFLRFRESRQARLEQAATTGAPPWQKDYHRGHRPDGTPASEHRLSLKLAAFREELPVPRVRIAWQDQAPAPPGTPARGV